MELAGDSVTQAARGVFNCYLIATKDVAHTHYYTTLFYESG